MSVRYKAPGAAWVLVGGYVDSASSLSSLMSCSRSLRRALSEDDSLWRGWYHERWGEVSVNWGEPAGGGEEPGVVEAPLSPRPLASSSWRTSYLRRLSFACGASFKEPNPQSAGRIYSCLRDVASYREAIQAGRRFDRYSASTIDHWPIDDCPVWVEELAGSVYFWDASSFRSSGARVLFDDCYCGRSAVFAGMRPSDEDVVDGEAQSADSEEDWGSHERNSRDRGDDHSYVLQSGSMRLGTPFPPVGCAIYGRKRDPVVIIIDGYEVEEVQYDMYGSEHDAAASVSLSIHPPFGANFRLIGMEQAYAFWDFGDSIERLMNDVGKELGVPEGEDPRIVLFLALQALPKWGSNADYFRFLVEAAKVEY